MSSLKESYNKFNSKRLFEARVTLLEKGIYPFSTFLKEYNETVETANKIEKLEEIVDSSKEYLPILNEFVTKNTSILLERKFNSNSVQAAMINYTFLTDAFTKYIKEAVVLLSSNKDIKSLYESYGNDSVELVSLCFKKTTAYKLMENKSEVDEVVSLLSAEVASMPFAELKLVCESMPKIKLYLSNEIHDQLANQIIS